MTVEDLIDAADRIAGEFERISRGLDANIFAVDRAEDRGALSRLQRVCHDAANALRRPR